MPSERALQEAAARLVQAMQAHEAERTVTTADDVIAARLAVKQAFINAGWDPPERTLREMERDRLLLREHAGRMERQPPPERPRRAERRHTLLGATRRTPFALPHVAALAM